MDFNFNEEQTLIQGQVAQFIQEIMNGKKGKILFLQN